MPVKNTFAWCTKVFYMVYQRCKFAEKDFLCSQHNINNETIYPDVNLLKRSEIF